MNSNPATDLPSLQMLKLGGSLITDKTRPRTPRNQSIARLAKEISSARLQNPGMRLILGHGAGSFAHVPAKFYGTRQGVHSNRDWRGFIEVWREAVALNRLVMQSLHDISLPAISLPPSASLTASGGQVYTWDLNPLQSALKAGLLPVIYGDVIFDHQLGGTILSTEDLFMHLARHLKPERLLLAGLEPGVWADFPVCTKLLPKITPDSLDQVTASLQESVGTDVTGGMASKVMQMVSLVTEIPNLKILVFSGEEPGLVESALLGKMPGTVIVNTSSV
jgi:isopentenyl phosphate kinase